MKLLKFVKARLGNESRYAGRSTEPTVRHGIIMQDRRIKNLRLERLYRAKQRKAPMQDQHVLVLGAEYDFVCVEAVRQQAARVVFLGDAETLDRTSVTGVEILPPDLSAISGESFDAIFLPHAHKRTNLGSFLGRVATLLRPKGVLVMECACSLSTNSSEWTVIKDQEAKRRYPSIQLLETVLLQDFAVRRVGKGALSNDDNIPHIVVHCSLLQATAMIITSKSGYGKSNLLRLFNPRDFPAISTDNFLSHLNKGKALPDRPLSKRIQAEIGDGPADWGLIGRMIAAEPALIEEFCAALVDICPVEARIFIVEGEVLRHDDVLTRLTAHLNAQNVRVWKTSPSARD